MRHFRAMPQFRDPEALGNDTALKESGLLLDSDFPLLASYSLYNILFSFNKLDRMRPAWHHFYKCTTMAEA